MIIDGQMSGLLNLIFRSDAIPIKTSVKSFCGQIDSKIYMKDLVSVSVKDLENQKTDNQF